MLLRGYPRLYGQECWLAVGQGGECWFLWSSWSNMKVFSFRVHGGEHGVLMGTDQSAEVP